EIHRGVLADRGMRTAARLDAGDTIRRQRARAHQELGVPLGVDVVVDRGDVVALAHGLAEQVHQRGLARSNGTADADSKRTVGIAAHADILAFMVFRSIRLMTGTASYIASRGAGRRDRRGRWRFRDRRAWLQSRAWPSATR